MPLGMATELQPFLRPIWETTTRLTLYSVMNALGWRVHVDKTTRGNQEVALNWRGTATTEQVLNSWLSCTFLWIFLNDVFIHVVRYSDSEYLNNWYNVPSPIWPFSLKWIPIRINYHRVEIYRPAHLICMLVISCKQTYWGTYDCYSHDHEVLTVIVLLKYGRPVAKCDPWIQRATEGPTMDGPLGDQWIIYVLQKIFRKKSG